ncbi:hypothetical protein FACS1894104_4750 [Actinomycetota bacterium]|nr:hypothetical protein FACS1894104_4750 [Actinomycetota bacterium]
MDQSRVFNMQVAKVYPMWVSKVQKKGRTKTEADAVICWLTGYSPDALDAAVGSDITMETFLNEASLSLTPIAI